MATRRRLLWPVLTLALVLALFLVYGPFRVRSPRRTVMAAAKQPARPGSRFVSVPFAGDTLSVHYEEMGTGEPVLLLLHGFAASTFSWREVLPGFAKRGRTVAFDRPAFGLTQRPLPETWQGNWREQNPYSLNAQIDLTVGLMDQLGIAEAVLVGNSAGGTVAMLTALAHPQRVKSLILIAPAVYAGGGAQSPFVRRLINTAPMRHLGPVLARQIKRWGNGFARSAWHDPTQITDEIFQGYQAPLQVADWDRALWEFTAAGAPSDLPARLRELELPVLVITGDDDRIVPTQQSIKLAAQLPNAQLVVVPDSGHLPHEECPQAVLGAIQSFLGG